MLGSEGEATASPRRPDGPSIACEAQPGRLDRDAGPRRPSRGRPTPTCDRWVDARAGSPSPLRQTGRESRASRPAEVADALADGVLAPPGPREARARARGSRARRLTRSRSSTLRRFVLNGLALAGTDEAEASSPPLLAGLCVPPRKTLTVPATAEVVERLKLKDGRAGGRRRPERALRQRDRTPDGIRLVDGSGRGTGPRPRAVPRSGRRDRVRRLRGRRVRIPCSRRTCLRTLPVTVRGSCVDDLDVAAGS